MKVPPPGGNNNQCESPYQTPCRKNVLAAENDQDLHSAIVNDLRPRIPRPSQEAITQKPLPFYMWALCTKYGIDPFKISGQVVEDWWGTTQKEPEEQAFEERALMVLFLASIG